MKMKKKSQNHSFFGIKHFWISRGQDFSCSYYFHNLYGFTASIMSKKELTYPSASYPPILNFEARAWNK